MRVLKEGEDVALRRLGLQDQHRRPRRRRASRAPSPSWRARACDALLCHFDSPFVSQRAKLMRLALSHALPTVAEATTFAEEAGSLLSYAPSDSAMVRERRGLRGQDLQGRSPAELPIKQPTKFELVVNLATARALRRCRATVDPVRADTLIE